MNFEVLGRYSYTPDSPYGKAYLLKDNWNDFGYRTLYRLVYIDLQGQRHKLGEVKIGQFDLGDSREPEVPKEFSQLSEDFFSLGQGDEYYEKIYQLPPAERTEILWGLRDIVYDEDLRNRALNEPVMKISLLRDVPLLTVHLQYLRILGGGARLSEYNFTYHAVKHPNSVGPAMQLDFHVYPESNPPTNIHVLIGRNGVGKTFLLNNMAASLLKSGNKFGRFEFEGSDILFSNIVTVSFSAFDNSDPLQEQREELIGILHSYVGLRKPHENGNKPTELKTPNDLRAELIESMLACFQTEAKRDRWKKAIESLETDDIFREANVRELVEVARYDNTSFARQMNSLFSRFSSGHMIVILSITKLVERVEERSLVLIDEPETHLHPPLLAAFIRAISDLLFNRNGVAIISTHSPVVLQEVPKSCVWRLQRSGAEARADRLQIESFGENVGALTSEVFGLEVDDAGYIKLLKDAVRESPTYRSALMKFSNQLGLEAQGILRAMFELKNREEE